MTLVISVASPRGLWQASDHRLTVNDRAVDDASIKHVRIEAEDGKALLAYAGLGKVRETHISVWVRKLLRGKRRTIERHLGVLTEAANRVLLPICHHVNTPHTFSIAAFKNDQPMWYGITSNVQPSAEGRTVGDKFVYRGVRLGGDASQVFINLEGQGAFGLPQQDELIEVIRGTIRRRSHKKSLGRDVTAVLARLVRDASSRVQCFDTVSPHCIVSHLRGPKDGFTHKFCGWDAKENRPFMHHIAGGHDVTAMIEILWPEIMRAHEHLRKGERPGNEMDDEAINEAFRKADWSPTDKL